MPTLRKARIVACSVLLTWSCAVSAVPGSLEFFENGPNDFDYGSQVELATGFGSGEFTFELWVKLNDSLPVGPTLGGSNQLQNWSDSDNQPYSSNNWWFHGNFLIDGHNNNDFDNGTFSLQVYGGGRIRWLFGDGVRQTGGPWAIQAYPATTVPSLLDGQWHQITLVRRWSGTSNADLELWVDGALIATETSTSRTDMATTYWDGWTGYPNNEQGWFFAAEKQAANGSIGQWEDYKGLVDEIRFWDRAKSASEISANFDDPVVGNEPGLLSVFTFGEAQGTVACDSIDPGLCILLTNTPAGVWSATDAPLSGASDTTAPTKPANLQGTAISESQIDLSWNASTDNVGVTSYSIWRDGIMIASTPNTNFNDTGLTANTDYVYTVSANDAAGNVSAASDSVNVTTQMLADTQSPTIPSGLQGASVSASQIDLSWNASTDNVGVTGYSIRRDGITIASTPNTNFNDTGLTANTNYVYTVSANDAAGNSSAQSLSVSVTTQLPSDNQAPTTPTNLQGTAVSTSRIDLTWNASTDNIGVTSYRIRRNGVTIANTANTNFSDTGLTANTSYDYTVSARDAAGNFSAQSPSVSVVTQQSSDTQAPTTPTNLQGAAVSTSRIDLTWSASTDNVGVTAYEIRRNGVMISSTANTNFSDTGLTANTSYDYTVSARDAAGNFSAQSPSVSVVTQQSSDTQAPTTPTNLQGAAVSTSRIDLTWSASTDNVGVTAYEIRRNGVMISSTANTNFSDTGLTANTSYDYTVSARDAAGNFSAQSPSVSVVTQQSSDTQAPTTPTNLQGAAVSTSRIDLTWSASTDNVGVTAYEIRRNGVMISSTANTNFSDAGLTANTSYLYTVSARDAAGNVSAASVSVSVLTPMSTDTQAPTAPTGLQGTAFSSSRIDLTWAASTDNVGVLGYDIQRNGANVGTTTDTDYSDTGLAANTRYTYEVIARDAAGNSSTVSTSVSVTTRTNNTNNKKSGGGSMGGCTLLLFGTASLWRRTRRGLRDSRSRPNLIQDSIAP